jgi:2-methylcitrate dehydratase PrpD
MTAVGLIFGELTADHYEDSLAADPRIDALREKMVCQEDPQYSRDYLDPAKRSIANAVQVFFADGTATERVEVQYPIGHRRRRAEAAPLLEDKLVNNLAGRLPEKQVQAILELSRDAQRLDLTPVRDLVDLFVM